MLLRMGLKFWLPFVQVSRNGVQVLRSLISAFIFGTQRSRSTGGSSAENAVLVTSSCWGELSRQQV
jgi:hypothetical protein